MCIWVDSRKRMQTNRFVFLDATGIYGGADMWQPRHRWCCTVVVVVAVTELLWLGHWVSIEVVVSAALRWLHSGQGRRLGSRPWRRSGGEIHWRRHTRIECTTASCRLCCVLPIHRTSNLVRRSNNATSCFRNRHPRKTPSLLAKVLPIILPPSRLESGCLQCCLLVCFSLGTR